MEPRTRNEREGSLSDMQFAPGDGLVTMGKTTLIKLGRIAFAIALAFAIGGIAVTPALADGHHRGGGDGGRGGQHAEGHDRGHQGGGYSYARQPSHYYAPQPNYYYAPEPDQYAYGSQQGYYSPAPSQGVNLFFGLF